MDFTARIRRLSVQQRREFRSGLLRIANEDSSRLVAYFKSRSTDEIDTAQLRRRLAERLPKYMVPSDFIQVASLPRLANGKIDRLRLPLSAPVARESEQRVEHPPADDVADAGPLEAKLAAVWARTLNTDYVLPEDDFFELGGHSLLGVQLLLEVKREFGVEIPLADLFEAPLFKDMAVRLDSPQTGPRVVSAIQSGGAGTPIFSFHGGDLTFATAFGDQRPSYIVFDSISTSTADMSSVEAIAKHYLKGIREVQPHGPYFLSGYSFGGTVAYETAIQLRRAGETVALVALIDSPPPNVDRWSIVGLRFYRLLSGVREQPGLLRKVSYLLLALPKNLWRRASRFFSKPGPKPQPRGHEEIRRANVQRYTEIGFAYRYPASDFACAVYMPERHPLWIRHLHRKWREVVQGPFTLECVEGATGHMDLTCPPHELQMARGLASRVNALDAQATGEGRRQESSQDRLP